MARPNKRKIPGNGRSGGRTTPKQSARYTPPVAKDVKVSPRWVPVLMFALLAAGLVIIILNYMGLMPGKTSNWYLMLGLAFVLGGIVTATQWH